LGRNAGGSIAGQGAEWGGFKGRRRGRGGKRAGN